MMTYVVLFLIAIMAATGDQQQQYSSYVDNEREIRVDFDHKNKHFIITRLKVNNVPVIPEATFGYLETESEKLNTSLV